MSAVSTTGADVPTSQVTIRPVDPSNYRPALVQVGVIVWLASELMFFSGLFAAFFALRAATNPWPPKGDTLDVGPVLVATILLVLSSFTMQYGVHRAIQGSKAGFIGWLTLTFILGCLFEGMQISDYIGRPFGIDTNTYGSAFFTLTGFHFLHVAGGLIGMILIGIRAWRSKRFGHRTVSTIEFLSYYWHFVDIVWVALFLAIFVLK